MSEKIYAIDHDTVLISVKDGAYMPEVREFLWMQEEVAEFEWNSRVWKPGSEFPRAPKATPGARRRRRRGKAQEEKEDQEEEEEGSGGGRWR